MAGYYLWGFVITLGVFLLGGLLAVVTARYTRSHRRRSTAEKRASEAVTRENYRHPVAKE